MAPESPPDDAAAAAAVQVTGPAPELPNEILDIICMNIDSAAKLRELRLMNRTWHGSATRALFSHLDVSMDLRSLAKLDNVAWSPMAKLVKSLRLREPAAERILPFEEEYWDPPTSHQQVGAGFVLHSPSEITKILAVSLNRLTAVVTIEVDVKMLPSTYLAEQLEIKLRSAVFQALSQTTLPKFRNLEYHESSRSSANDSDGVESEKGFNDFIGKARCLDIHVEDCFADFGEDVYVDDQSLWARIMRHGSQQLEKLRFHTAEAPWETYDIAYNFTNLTEVDLNNFEFDSKSLMKLLGPSLKTLRTVKLARIRLTAGSFEGIFSCLKRSRSLIQLELREMMYEEEWMEYIEGKIVGHWWLENNIPLWNMFCSARAKDAFACKDLLSAVNRDRKKLGMGPAFDTRPRWKDIREQAGWIMRLRREPFAFWPKSDRARMDEVMERYPLLEPERVGW